MTVTLTICDILAAWQLACGAQAPNQYAPIPLNSDVIAGYQWCWDSALIIGAESYMLVYRWLWQRQWLRLLGLRGQLRGHPDPHVPAASPARASPAAAVQATRAGLTLAKGKPLTPTCKSPNVYTQVIPRVCEKGHC